VKKNCFAIIAATVLLPAGVAWSEQQAPSAAAKPYGVNTGDRSGRVVDAVSGQPIEAAVVVYRWETKECVLDCFSRPAAMYETTTNKDGKYTIPNQLVHIERPATTRLQPEQVFVYKGGYVWYQVSDKGVQDFLVYLPKLEQAYTQQNNVVKLQPWAGEMSHLEHVAVPQHVWTMSRLLPGAMAYEVKQADAEREANKKLVQSARKARRLIRSDQRAWEKKEISRDEYVKRLHGYLGIEDTELLKSVSLALKDCNDSAAIPALITYLAGHVYRESFENAFNSFCYAINQRDITNPGTVPQRQQFVRMAQEWWERNKNKGPIEWSRDSVMKPKAAPAAQRPASPR
jgi:hypothetical protein